MALNMKKVNNRNKADEMIEQMMSENSSSSASGSLGNTVSGKNTYY